MHACPLMDLNNWRVQVLSHVPKCVYNLSIQDDFTPLHWAAQNGHAHVVDYLMKKGANAQALTKVCISYTLQFCVCKQVSFCYSKLFQ